VGPGPGALVAVEQDQQPGLDVGGEAGRQLAGPAVDPGADGWDAVVFEQSRSASPDAFSARVTALRSGRRRGGAGCRICDLRGPLTLPAASVTVALCGRRVPCAALLTLAAAPLAAASVTAALLGRRVWC
jgi:hypothetical protein